MTGHMRQKTPVLPVCVPAALIFCVMIPLFVLPAQANPNQIWPSDDSGVPLDVFPANEIVYVTGDLDLPPYQDQRAPSATSAIR